MKYLSSTTRSFFNLFYIGRITFDAQTDLFQCTFFHYLLLCVLKFGNNLKLIFFGSTIVFNSLYVIHLYLFGNITILNVFEKTIHCCAEHCLTVLLAHFGWILFIPIDHIVVQ